MKLSMDADVQKVLEYMQSHIRADRLVGVASAVNGLAESLWGQYDGAAVLPLWFAAESTLSPRPTARESGLDSACGEALPALGGEPHRRLDGWTAQGIASIYKPPSLYPSVLYR